jgi:hypothetical protein
MRDNEGHSTCCGGPSADERDQPEPANQADQLTALAQEARLLEFGLEGDGDASAHSLAADLENALSTAMDAESPDELTRARTAIDTVLGRVISMGMSLSAQMTDIEVDGILGTARMPVLTAVLSADA